MSEPNIGVFLTEPQLELLDEIIADWLGDEFSLLVVNNRRAVEIRDLLTDQLNRLRLIK